MADTPAGNRTKAESKRKRDIPEVVKALAPESPWLVDVDVYLKDAGDAEAGVQPRFRLKTCLPMDAKDPDQVIAFHNRGRHGFNVKFNLIDETNNGAGSGYRFPSTSKKDQALWSRQGPGCPPKNHGKQWPEFTAIRVIEPDRTTLLVRNLNDTQTKFGYTLRVTNDDGRSYIDLDPIGDNHNGTYS